MTKPVSIPNAFSAPTTGTTVQLDANFTTLRDAINDTLTYANYATDSGSVNAYAITLSPAPAAQANLLGVVVTWKANTANTAASTLNVNALGAQNIVRPGGGAVQAGDINGVVAVVWDGTNYVLQTATPANAVGPKNRLINGGSEIWQRGTSIAITASSNGYGADRWVITTGANQASTITQVAGLTSQSQWAAKVQRNNAQTGTTAMVYEQPFELNNIFPVRGQIVTVSFTAKAGANWSPASGTLTCILATGTGAAARRGTAAYTGEATPISFGSNLTTSVTRYTSTSTAIATTTTQMTLYFTWTPVGTAGADDSFTIDDIQLEFASVASAFELPDMATELVKCQRYFEKTFAQGTTPAQGVGNLSAGVLVQQAASPAAGQIDWRYKVTKRTTPTIVTYNPVSANANGRDTANTVDLTLGSTYQTSDSNVVWSFTTNVADGAGMQIHATASAEL